MPEYFGLEQDPAVRNEARDYLSHLFSGIGRSRGKGGEEGETALSGILGGDLAQQFAEFAQMPIELAQIFAGMGFQIAELVVVSLGEAGYVLVKGITPA